MRAIRARTRPTVWIAVVVILLASVAPSLTHALGIAQGGSRIEVCTAQGSKWIDEAGDESPTAPFAAHVFEHCPYCSIHVPGLGMPPSPMRAPLLIESHGEYPVAFYAAPRTLFAWRSAQPRAPPHSC